MAYIRHKVIKGHVYYYLVEGRREGTHVRQKVLKYLGKHGSLSAASGVAYRGFQDAGASDNAQSVKARQRIQIKKAFKAFGFTVRHNLSGRTTTRGCVRITRNQKGETIRRSVSLLKTPDITTMCHELGHVVDYYLRDKGESFWQSDTFKKNQVAIRAEFERVGAYAYRHVLENDPSLINHSFFQNYVFTDNEGYANAFDLFLTDYQKAKSVVPNMVGVFHEAIRNDAMLREQIEAFDVWKLDGAE